MLCHQSRCMPRSARFKSASFLLGSSGTGVGASGPVVASDPGPPPVDPPPPAEPSAAAPPPVVAAAGPLDGAGWSVPHATKTAATSTAKILADDEAFMVRDSARPFVCASTFVRAPGGN